jgi:4,5-dihydroxyphthalate decarboxylase
MSGADGDSTQSASWKPTLVAGGRLALTLAISRYDHVRDLTAGEVTADGIALTALDLPVEEIFHRFLKFREWEISELSFAKYAALTSQGDSPFTAIPVFPSRFFRHSSIYVRAGGPVKAPSDLKGRRVGIPEWAQTAAVYSRGVLVEDYGLKLTDIDWIQAGVNEPGRREKVALNLPPGVRLTPQPEKSLDAMLLAGEIDAVMSAHAPAAAEAGDPRVTRLFENFHQVEEEYWKRTRVFPIMHVIAIRREVVDRFPWVPMNLMKAFEEAKLRSVRRLTTFTASRYPIPWMADIAARTYAAFGGDPFSYGIEANRPTLDTFLRWAFEQGVCRRRLTPDELFAPGTEHRFKI